MAAGATGRPRQRDYRSPRSKARKKAIELLFEAEQRGVDPAGLLAERVERPTTQTPLPKPTLDTVSGVVANWSAINELLSTYSRGWPVERMPAVDRTILRVATYEVVWSDVPDGVAIAEAVEFARLLSTDDSPRFVGGLLNRIAEVKPTLV